jgi:pyruvate,water dikinase
MERMLKGAVERWTDEGRPKYLATIQSWESSSWQEMPATEIIDAANQLVKAAIDAYLALVSGVLPVAWISEALFTLSYNRLIKRRNDPSAPTFLMGYDNIPIRSDKSLYDIAEYARDHSELASYLTATSADQLANELDDDQIPSGIDPDDWREWKNRFQKHLQQFGGTIYNLDFSFPVPADDPTPLLETVKLYIEKQGVNPHTRQQNSAEQREQASQYLEERLKGMRLNIFKKSLARAQEYAPLREDGLAEVGLCYPLLRQMLREVGRRFVENGVIQEIDDIFWLEEDEVYTAADSLDHGKSLEDLSKIVPQRKSIWRAACRAEPPIMLPNKILGLDISKMKAGRSNRNFLSGVAASPGSVSAPACILNGPEDFEKMNTGDVLVASITTPAWTPLFARASAVVTDIGGPLSHGSIVAREYGIPAVLGTVAATKRITHGQVITVDGDAGKVFLKDE